MVGRSYEYNFFSSASLPPNTPDAELTVFPFFFVNFGPSAFHLMPQGFEQPPGLGGSGLDPVTVNGRMVACNPAGTEFLLSTNIVPQAGDYECDGPYPPLAKKVATPTLTPAVAAACRRWYTKFGFSDELRIAYDENQYLVALKASPTSHDLSERLNTALQLAEDAQRFRVQHHPIPYVSAQANWSAWLLSVLRIGASYGLWYMAATKGHYDAPAQRPGEVHRRGDGAVQGLRGLSQKDRRVEQTFTCLTAAQGSKSHVESRGLYTPRGYCLGSIAKVPSDQGVLVLWR